MRQLTSLDAQFLAMEDRRTIGHTSGLAILDPATAPGGRLGLAQMSALIEQRLHLLPPFRWRLAEVPFGLNHPYWIDDSDFDLEYSRNSPWPRTTCSGPGPTGQIARRGTF